MGGEASLERRLVVHVLQPGGSLGDCKSWREANRYKHTSSDKRVRLQNLLCVGFGKGGGVAGCGGRSVSKVQRKFLKEIPFYAS